VSIERNVKLFRDGHDQAVRIPREFELPGDDAVMRKEAGKIIIEAKQNKSSLIDLLDSWKDCDEEFPPVADPPTEAEDIF
jgi:antitoxin VapB